MVNFSVFFLLFFAAFFSYYSPFQYRGHSSYPIKYEQTVVVVVFFLLPVDNFSEQSLLIFFPFLFFLLIP